MGKFISNMLSCPYTICTISYVTFIFTMDSLSKLGNNICEITS